MRTPAWVLGLAALAALAAAGLYWSLLPRGHAPSPPHRAAPPASKGEKGYPLGLSEEALEHLETWLRESTRPTSPPQGLRDPFHPEALVPPPRNASVPAPLASTGPPPPRLEGFVYKGSEALAAIRFDGKMWLLGPGQRLGPYRVEALTVPENVRLVAVETGQALLLALNVK